MSEPDRSGFAIRFLYDHDSPAEVVQQVLARFRGRLPVGQRADFEHRLRTCADNLILGKAAQYVVTERGPTGRAFYASCLLREKYEADVAPAATEFMGTRHGEIPVEGGA